MQLAEDVTKIEEKSRFGHSPSHFEVNRVEAQNSSKEDPIFMYKIRRVARDYLTFLLTSIFSQVGRRDAIVPPKIKPLFECG